MKTTTLSKEYWPTIVIIEGVPYVLKKEIEPTENDPCKLCALKEKCGGLFFLELCASDNRDDSWFFVEDWDIVESVLSDLVNKGVE